MESSSSSSSSSLHTVSFSLSSPESASCWDYINLIIIRPILAILFVFLFISLGWFLAWKLVLVHVPLVQEIFGLRKKPAKPKPRTGRFSEYYSNIDSRNTQLNGQKARNRLAR